MSPPRPGRHSRSTWTADSAGQASAHLQGQGKRGVGAELPTSYPRLGTVGWWVHSEDMEGKLNVPETPWKEELGGSLGGGGVTWKGH